MFMGRYNHTIDPKGRLSIPSKYREILGEEFVVSKGMDGCLFVYAEGDWKVFEEKLASLRDFAGLEKDVVLAGMGGRIEIWSLDRWNANSSQVDINRISQGMMNLGLTI